MKKSFSKIKGFFVMAFAAITSFVSKAMGQALESWGTKPSLRGQSYYGVEMPEPVLFKPEVSSYSPLTSFIFKWVGILLLGVIFLIGIISYFRIRKVDDKEIKSKKIRNTIIIVSVILFIDILARLCYRMYENNMFDKMFG